jgi:hypothetical protein
MQFRYMPRPTIFDRPMTGAERVYRHRGRRRLALERPKTRKERARIIGVSERTFYNIQRFDDFAAFQWNRDILDGGYGRVGLRFLAIVCAYGSSAQQRLIHDTIVREGASAGRAAWRQLLETGEVPSPYVFWGTVQYHASPDQRRSIEDTARRKGEAAARAAWRRLVDAGEVVPRD